MYFNNLATLALSPKMTIAFQLALSLFLFFISNAPPKDTRALHLWPDPEPEAQVYPNFFLCHARRIFSLPFTRTLLTLYICYNISFSTTSVNPSSSRPL